MKTILISKTNDFSDESKLILHIYSEKIHIKGFGSYKFSLNPGDSFYLTHQWTSSPKMYYDNLAEENSLIVKPRLDKRLLILIMVTLILCSIVFFILKSRWSFLPMIPFVVYILIYLTILRKKYLVFLTVKNNLVSKQSNK